MSTNSSYYDILREIEENVGVKEGIFGVITLLSAIARHPNISSYNLSKLTSIPIPICVAIRNEFIKKGWCKKKNGSVLTHLGEQVVNSLAKINRDFYCEKCDGLGVTFPFEYFDKELETLKRFSRLRGKPRTEIDQSFATPETSIKRILFLIHKYDIFRQNFAFLGDSDLTSIALALFAKNTQNLMVFDIDPRLKEIIEKANKELGINIKFLQHDLRKPIPAKFHGKFNCILTDPPYTLPGVKLFISRAIQLINSKEHGAIYLSFSNKPPDEMAEIQQALIKMGCIITDIIPRFNDYIGAQKLGGKSILFRLLTTKYSKPIITSNYTDKLYTGDLNPVIRFYQCTKCSHVFRVGKNCEYPNIERLKEKGCPFCHNSHFNKIKEEKLKV